MQRGKWNIIEAISATGEWLAFSLGLTNYSHAWNNSNQTNTYSLVNWTKIESAADKFHCSYLARETWIRWDGAINYNTPNRRCCFFCWAGNLISGNIRDNPNMLTSVSAVEWRFDKIDKKMKTAAECSVHFLFSFYRFLCVGSVGVYARINTWTPNSSDLFFESLTVRALLLLLLLLFRDEWWLLIGSFQIIQHCAIFAQLFFSSYSMCN